jgi:hypothetical protein
MRLRQWNIYLGKKYKMANVEERVQLIFDELKVLDSIFCGKDEFLVNDSRLDAYIESSCRNLVEGKIENLQLTVKIPSENYTEMRLSVSLSKDYPSSLPGISVLSTQLTRKKTSEIQELLKGHAKESLAQFSEPIVLKLVEWLQEKISEICLETEVQVSRKSPVNDDKLYICVLKFDHMRSRKKYLKTITNWVTELNLNGCILFWEKIIIEIIEGFKSDISKYLKRLRTCTVDVDSAGRACKERMMDVLCEVENTSQNR